MAPPTTPAQSRRTKPRKKQSASVLATAEAALAVYVRIVYPFLNVFSIMAAAAAASYVSQLSLAPVYGDIPSSLFHARNSELIFALVWLVRVSAAALGVGALPFLSLRPALIPVLVLYTPAILTTVFRFSTEWGAINGPVFTEAATFYPVLVLSVFAATRRNGVIGITVATALAFAVYKLVLDGFIKPQLPAYIGSNIALTRCGLTHVVGAVFAVLQPSWLLLGAFPALFHSMTVNPMCVFTPALNETLAPWNHTIIARRESVTGYVSVLDNTEAGYRVMRCDHSLLGGEWQKAPKGLEHLARGGFKEPIYAVFVLLEAVRLVEPGPKNPNPRALTM